MDRELQTKAYEILERSRRPLTAQDCEREVENGRRAYESLYSNFTQRKQAMETMQIYGFLQELLQRAGR